MSTPTTPTTPTKPIGTTIGNLIKTYGPIAIKIALQYLNSLISAGIIKGPGGVTIPPITLPTTAMAGEHLPQELLDEPIEVDVAKMLAYSARHHAIDTLVDKLVEHHEAAKHPRHEHDPHSLAHAAKEHLDHHVG